MRVKTSTMTLHVIEMSIPYYIMYSIELKLLYISLSPFTLHLQLIFVDPNIQQKFLKRWISKLFNFQPRSHHRRKILMKNSSNVDSKPLQNQQMKCNACSSDLSRI